MIGSHVVDSLIDLGWRVVVLDDLSGGFKRNVNPKAEFIKGSIVNHRLIDSIFEAKEIEYVFHLAAYAAEGLSHFIKRFNYRNNLIGSVNLINAAVNHDVKCLAFTSSIAVYGEAECPMTEDTPPTPVDSYGIAKFAVEQELAASHSLFGLNYIVFRPHNVYGERQNIGDKYRNVIGIFMNKMMCGEPVVIFGDGSQTRAFTYIQDVAPVMAEAMLKEQAYNQIFNVGADEPVSVKELALEVARAMGVEPKIRCVSDREEVRHAYCSHEKIRRVLDCRPTVPLTEGIARMAEWAKRHGSRKSKFFKNIEIPRSLPDTWSE